MCGRYAISAPPADIAGWFGAVDALESYVPNYNAAPTTVNPVVIERTGERKVKALRWGLVPSWAKDLSSGPTMINARLESIDGKPAFRRPLAVRRCLVPADGWYEWYAEPGSERDAKRKQPFFVRRRDGGPVAFAGLYEIWRDPRTGEWVWSYAIVTGPAPPALAYIHDRAPVALAPGAWDAWLDPARTDPDQARALLVPAPAELLEAYPVSRDVNDANVNRPDLRDPLPAEEG
jgi:putative SOS response-associated peptidase YedK